ncbi:erythromycin esterase family protein [Haloplanus aerogenes]|uniref:Erythromycin esterase family protein n=1 Tax=Haloplanus aerogenes TaxID=660522 RepID=A0A3M0DTS7_9EURY|nr:erythromycin esterase family protein [Haloplanus aerogenes]AZH25631.1 erythromycin esterase family protein [Haloplanus aerogenes]RMB25355.1 erythromycin esterase-like protein [Haloplanus aerogenes]
MRLQDRTSWTEPGDIDAAVADVRSTTHGLEQPSDLDRLVEQFGDRTYVLLGEASHGTSEYYRWRARLTARLVQEKDFSFVAVEGDWTNCYEVNRYVKGLSVSPETIRDALEAFERWPTWMWANWEALEFLDWLELHNQRLPEDDRIGFYGLDVYSLFESMDAVVDYLEDVDPDAAAEARAAYRCFEPYGEDAQEYARALRMVPETCEDEVVEMLTRLREQVAAYDHSRDDYFNAEQNALVAKNAEQYYREMVRGEVDSWNIRDRHMVETLERLQKHHGSDSKGIVWAHNTHIGDARATDMEARGRLNVGQLVREHEGRADVALIGMGSHQGTVIAADSWGARLEEMTVPPAQEGSYEHVFEQAGGGDCFLVTGELPDDSPLTRPRGHRAIGVVYHPAHEAGNYVPTVLPERYDAFMYFDETSALHPLDVHADVEAIPDLYPWGF